MVKKKISRRIIEKKNFKMNCNCCGEMNCSSCCCGGGRVWGKLHLIAFVLFLVTVWNGFKDVVMGIHWGWFLGATIIFGIIFHMRFFRKR